MIDYLLHYHIFIETNVLVLGLIVGSFLNVCISRWPAEQSVVRPRSRCPKCQNLIVWFDNIPVLSWLFLRAKCRHCSQKISWIYPGVELLTGLAFVGMWKALLLVVQEVEEPLENQAVLAILLTGLFLVAISIVVIFVDAKHFEIPDEISLNMMPVGPLLCLFFPSVMAETLYFNMHGYDAVSSQVYCLDWLQALLMSIGGVIAGGGILYLLAIGGEALLKKEAMGFGDIKLLAMLGGFLGIEGVIITLVLACCLGSVYGIIALIITRSNKLPFGPWIVMAALMVYVWKYDILEFTIGLMNLLNARTG